MLCNIFVGNHLQIIMSTKPIIIMLSLPFVEKDLLILKLTNLKITMLYLLFVGNHLFIFTLTKRMTSCVRFLL